jgi:murein DD-endopeptidase MepM/ murein hydrolase activator NlpD
VKNVILWLIIVLFLCSCGGGSSTNNSQNATAEVLFSSTEGTPDNVIYGGGPIDWPSNRRFKLPLSECSLLFDFGRPNPDFGNKLHLGQDLDAPALSDLYAIGNGQIVFSTFREGSLNWGGIFVLQINQPEQFYVIYGHVDKSSLPSVGSMVTSGQVISKLENNGVHAWNKAHLHFQLSKGTFSLPSGSLSPPGYADFTTGWENPIEYLSQFSNTSTTPSVPVAEAAVSFSPSGPYYGYDNPITVTRGQSVTLYFSADKDVNGDGKASLDPNGWTDADNGVSLGGKAEWNTDLNPGAPTFEKTISNPSSPGDANIGPFTYTFNDAPGTYEYQMLRITDRKGAISNVSKIRIKVVAGANQTPIAEAGFNTSSSGTPYGYDNPLTVTRGQSVNLYFFANKDVNGDGVASIDPDGWTDADNGVSSGGKVEWNTDLNQGAPTFEKTISNPSSPGDANIGPLTYTFNDAPGTYEYQMLRITDRKGVISNVSKIRIKVVAGANQAPIAEAGVNTSSSGTPYGYDNPLTVTRGQSVNLYFFANKDVNGDGVASIDPDGWTDADNGVSSGGKVEWNTDLNQGTPTFEKTISNPYSPGDANIGPFTYTFNDSPGTYEYQMLRITDRKGAKSNVSTIRIKVK